MLTGDNENTAVSIGLSSALITPDMDVIEILVNSEEEARNLLKTEISKDIVSKNLRHKSVLNVIKAKSDTVFLNYEDSQTSKSTTTPRYQIIKENLNILEDNITIRNFDSINQCLVIDGKSLSFILNDMISMKYFIFLSALSKTVLCCRVSSLQKSKIVKIIKNNLVFNPITLAVGDGANDVLMLQEAHIGVGIYGKEGFLAANSSDYSIKEFSHLLPLLQVHGR